MFSLIPMPYKILASVLIWVVLSAVTFAAGAKIEANYNAAKQLAAERLAADRYRAEVERGNTLSASLAKAESITHQKTIERIKYVPQVTTGRDCLSADAVQLLNGAGYPKLSAPAGQPAAESPPAPAATDRDIEEWAVGASGQYEICAERLNMLVDWASKGDTDTAAK